MYTYSISVYRLQDLFTFSPYFTVILTFIKVEHRIDEFAG